MLQENLFADLLSRFPRPAWVKLDRLRTGVGLACSKAHKWGMASRAA